MGEPLAVGADEHDQRHRAVGGGPIEVRDTGRAAPRPGERVVVIPAAVPTSSSSRPAVARLRKPPPRTGSTVWEVDRWLGLLDRDHGQVGGGDPLFTVEPDHVEPANRADRVRVGAQPHRPVGPQRTRLADAAHHDVDRRAGT